MLVLEIRLPRPGQGLWTDLGALWPPYLAFALSCFVIVGVWINHMGILRLTHEVTRPLLLANAGMLLPWLALLVTFALRVWYLLLRFERLPPLTAERAVS